jgi:cyclopropane fatty-acyl-phospholipid synthase-like methyltransferase
MVLKTQRMTRNMRQRFVDIQAHYDISNDFFSLFLDPTRTYSCAYFERDGMTLEEAQIAKLDLNLDKLALEPGMTLLDIGCGWGSTMKRALEKYDVNVIGLTLSENQKLYTESLLDTVDTKRSHKVLLEGWEDFHQPVDRIVSVEAFEHFGFEKYPDFFKNAYENMPADGRMTIQSSTGYHPDNLIARGKPFNSEGARFIVFMCREIFPGGRIPTAEMMVESGEQGGFVVPECRSLATHYVETLRQWGDVLESKREEAIALQSEEVYDRYMRFFRGCQHYFEMEMIDCNLVTYLKPDAAA